MVYAVILCDYAVPAVLCFQDVVVVGIVARDEFGICADVPWFSSHFRSSWELYKYATPEVSLLSVKIWKLQDVQVQNCSVFDMSCVCSARMSAIFATEADSVGFSRWSRLQSLSIMGVSLLGHASQMCGLHVARVTP